MSSDPAPFSFAESERRFGPDVIAELDRIAEEAPPIGAEAREQLRALFATTRRRTQDTAAADAA